MHPPEAAVPDVRDGQSPHHQEGREDEREARERGADEPAADRAEIHRQLRRERTGRELRKCEAFDVLVGRDPVALVDRA
jgi:hypothetical protein